MGVRKFAIGVTSFTVGFLMCQSAIAEDKKPFDLIKDVYAEVHCPVLNLYLNDVIITVNNPGVLNIHTKDKITTYIVSSHLCYVKLTLKNGATF